MKKIELRSGEYLSIKAIEIRHIPDISVIDTRINNGTSVEADYRQDFGGLLKEIHQIYSDWLVKDNHAEISLELLWQTMPATNQPYRADICICLLVRAISRNQSIAIEESNMVSESICSLLRLQNYGFEEIDYDGVISKLNNISEEKITAINRDALFEDLHNQLMPYCFSFTRLNAFSNDLSGLVNCLIERPNSAVSFMLIPARHSIKESEALTQNAQTLSVLSRGVTANGIGNISLSSAATLSDTYQYYQDNRNNALFWFSVLVWGESSSAKDITSKIYGVFSHDPSKPVNLKYIELDSMAVSVKKNYHAFPWVINEAITQFQGTVMGLSGESQFNALSRIPYLITAEEASGFFRLPIGSPRISAGLPIIYTSGSAKTYSSDLINSGDITIGQLKRTGKDTIGIGINDLAKHMLVAGMPGSGKTTFLVGLLDRLWKNHGVPFLVFEPAKNEYRALVQSIPDLQIFTPGKSAISPLMLNPFMPPKNVRLETYKSVLKTAFSAAVSMTSPLDKIFEETVNNCYSDNNWLDTYTIDDRGRIFNISDFIKCFRHTFAEIGYTGDARNIGRAGEVRLNSLVNLFDNYNSIPIEDLLTKPTVIELAAIENSEQKSLIIALLLLSILSYVNANYLGAGGLKNVILLEEAHVLLGDTINGSQVDAYPSQIAQGLIKRMLAEMRSYGIGIVIADQSPRKVTSDVVALTDLKLVFRLVEAADKRIIADSMNMDESQENRLARLKPGEAFLFFNRLDEPEEIVTPDYRLDKQIDITLSDDEIAQRSIYWKGKEKLLRPYPECEYISACKNVCNKNRRVLAKEIARRIFNRYIKTNATDFGGVENAFKHITANVKEELNGEPFSSELLSCVKCQLLRKIKYQTNIPLREIQIQNSLKK